MSKDSESSASACPVAKDGSRQQNSSSSSSWASWFGWGANQTDTKTSTSSKSNGLPSGCPVSNDKQKPPASLEEAAAYAQTPHPDQKGVALSTHRVISSIPRGATERSETGPHHQPPLTKKENACKAAADDNSTSSSSSNNHSSQHWMYPSEQQFFHALRKKGWDNVEAESIPSVLQIHNTINERTWKQVQEWEQNMDISPAATRNVVETDLKLVRFMGRPNDMSPQAFLWTKIFRWADPPFDRHDWYVQKQSRGPNTNHTNDYPVQRYVIDYYMFPPLDPQMPPTPFVDARPALDSPRAVYLRAVRLLQEELPGITSEFQAWRAKRKSYYDGSLPTTKATASS